MSGPIAEMSIPANSFSLSPSRRKCLEVNSRMLHLFARLIETQACHCPSSIREKDYAQDARAFIDSCYSEPIKIQDVADVLHIHPNYLCSVFKAAYGQTPREYLKALRMERASTLLLRTEQPVSTIAASVAFPAPFSSPPCSRNTSASHLPPIEKRDNRKKIPAGISAGGYLFPL